MDDSNNSKETKKEKFERIGIITGVCIVVCLPVLYCALCF